MRVKVNIDCTPEEVRRFIGLPDVAPLNERYVTMMSEAVSGAANAEQMARMMKDFGPWGEMGGRLVQQFAAMAAGDAGGAARKPKSGGKG